MEIQFNTLFYSRAVTLYKQKNGLKHSIAIDSFHCDSVFQPIWDNTFGNVLDTFGNVLDTFGNVWGTFGPV